MSSILKALEKVDESQRSRRPAGTGGLPKGRGRRPAWLIPAWALGGAAVATLATYALMGGFSHPSSSGSRVSGSGFKLETPNSKLETFPAAAKPAQLPAAGAAAKQAGQPPANTVAQPAAKATVNSAQPQLPAKASAKQQARPAAVAAKPAVVAQPAPVRQAVVQTAPVVAAPEPVAPAPAAAQPPLQKSRPEIRVTGIAWQNNSESSFAMVNGRPMRQGNVVDGYKIEQIYEDSVRFSSSKGNSLVVPLGAGEE